MFHKTKKHFLFILCVSSSDLSLGHFFWPQLILNIQQLRNHFSFKQLFTVETFLINVRITKIFPILRELKVFQAFLKLYIAFMFFINTIHGLKHGVATLKYRMFGVSLSSNLFLHWDSCLLNM